MSHPVTTAVSGGQKIIPKKTSGLSLRVPLSQEVLDMVKTGSQDWANCGRYCSGSTR